ncbi:MAG TPA: PAS domain S-box protein [Syntrophales bacterium]|jgi:PAS domain S-box-containing protein|nr:PAS domain S-box protein [Syntrophales bacterium]HRR46241.1 PAS domain S-box protein [Syntrophales bacterium]HRU87691.1 PAS domain S-box protein [Syntrophales bacterium]
MRNMTRAAEEKLVQERKVIVGIIEGSPIPTFVIDRKHEVIFWNKACEELTGFAAADMIGTDKHYMPFYGTKRPLIADLIVDQDIVGLEKYYGGKRVKKSLKVHGAYEARDFYVDLGGQSRHLYFLAAPIYDERGEIIAAVETLQDVTRERLMELSLKEYADNLRDELEKNITLRKTIEGIIEGSPIPMFVIGKDHRIMFWNRAFTELSGYDGKHFIGTDRQYVPFYPEKRPVIADLIVDDDIEKLEKFYGKKNVQKSPIIEGAYEAWDFYPNIGGRSRHLYFLAAPIRDDKGQVIAAVETLQDITREEEMSRHLKEYAETLENELKENIRLRKEIEGLYNYMQTVLESSPDTLFELDSEGIITFVSRDRRSDGLLASQIKGRHFTEYAPAHKDFLLERWEEIKKGNFKPFEMEVNGSDGKKQFLLITPCPLKGATDRYVLVRREITEFKELEKKYYESQKLAAIGQLSAGIAHEVRNPLSSIKMSLQILEKRLQPSGNDLKRFRIAQREVEHLEELVNDVLIYARPGEPKRMPTDLRRTIENALEMVQKSLSDKHVAVTLAVEEELPHPIIDGAMLEQALQNIFRNAIEAMEADGKLHVSARESGSQPHAVTIEITDNGCGMDEETLAHLFNPFFTQKRYGTGLGLTQVKKIIDLHKGNIDIESAKGMGTKVLITLPLDM